MATNFPLSLDTYADVASTTLQSAVVAGRKHHNYVNDFGDALVAIETLLGITGSTDPSSITYNVNLLLTSVASMGTELANIYFTGTNAVGFFGAPHAWDTTGGLKVLQIGTSSLESNGILSHNVYNDGNYKILTAGHASLIGLEGGGLYFDTATAMVADAPAVMFTRLRIMPTGEVGIGTIPELWHESLGVLQVGSASSIFSIAGERYTGIGANLYSTALAAASFKHMDAGPCSVLEQGEGALVFRSAPSGVSDAAAALTTKMLVNADGGVAFPLLHNNSNPGNIRSGTYTATLTGVANVTGTLFYFASYVRVGNVVTVAMAFRVTTTTAGVETIVGISLPVASDFIDMVYCSGTAGSATLPSGVIISDHVNNRAELHFLIASSGNFNWWSHFTYVVM